MNPSRKQVILTPNIVRVSRQFGEAMAKWYDSPEGRASASRSRSGEWGAELDPIRQGQGKAGEYAVALHYGLDPKKAVKRSFGNADDGGDVRITERMVIDAKTTAYQKKWMLWSSTINDLYWGKKFDALVSVSIDDDDWSQCWIEGWITKQDFFDRKMIADGVNDQGKLKRGTWFMRKADLDPIDTLLAGFAGYNADGHFIHYCRCGKEAGLGSGVSLMKNQFGTWWCCEDHKP